MSNIKERVAVLPWPEMENCFLCISGTRKKENIFGDVQSKPNITFAYIDGNSLVEWDGEFGAVTQWIKCEEDDEEKIAKPHYIWPFAKSGMRWSQCAVTDNFMPQDFTRGSYDGIFSTLKMLHKSWHEDEFESVA